MPELADLRQPAGGSSANRRPAGAGRPGPGVRIKTIGGRTHGSTQAPIRAGTSYGRAAGVVRPARGRNTSGSTRGGGMSKANKGVNNGKR